MFAAKISVNLCQEREVLDKPPEGPPSGRDSTFPVHMSHGGCDGLPRVHHLDWNFHSYHPKNKDSLVDGSLTFHLRCPVLLDGGTCCFWGLLSWALSLPP